MLIFRVFGIILFTPLILLWQLLTQFLLSPWGLIIPITLLIALFSIVQLQKTPDQLAQFYAEQLETCDETELPQLLEVLVRTGDAGISGLVKGLTSSRESVYTACRNVLQHEFEQWQQSEQREHHYLVLSEALLHTCNRFSPAAQTEAMWFIDQMMQIRSTETVSSESAAHRRQTLVHCERILDQLASARQKINEPQSTDFAPDTVAALDRRVKQPMLLASNGKPFVPASKNKTENETLLADAGNFSTLAVPRADRLWAYQQSQQYRPAETGNPSRLSDDRASQGLASFSPPSSQTAVIEERIAQNFAENDTEPSADTGKLPDISEEYRNGKLSESGGTFHSDHFLTPELRNTPLDRVPHLPTTQLMQLLHHPKLPYIESAQKTLMGRDGFQESHLKLAWRLYHPIPAVRQEIIDLLPNTPNVQASVWLSVLLNDPSNEVRYRTASFLATTGDPALQRLLIDRGKRDNDARIVNLAERLNEPRGVGR